MSTENDREAHLPTVPREATRWRFSAVSWKDAATEPRAVAWEIPGQPHEVHLVVAGVAHQYTGGPPNTLEDVCALAVLRFPGLRWSTSWWPRQTLAAPTDPAPKPRWSLLPMGALRACAELATWGVVKHPNATWLTLSTTEHWDAAMRHMTAWPTQPTDPESGRSHLVHAAVRLLYAIALGT